MTGYNIDDKDQIYFVYDFMPLGSLKHHLHDFPPAKKSLDWNTRMKIAAGAAKGIKYLHEKLNPPVIHGNIRPSNILICEGYHAKVTDFFMFKERIPEVDESGYARCIDGRCPFHRHAPEFVSRFKLTQRSDIYSFGLVLLELITGRIAKRDPLAGLTIWAKQKLMNSVEFMKLADPLLEGQFPEQGLYQALFLAAECLQYNEDARPSIGYVVNVLSNLVSEIYDPNAIQMNRAGTLAIGNIEKQRLTEQWRDVYCFFF